MGSEGFDEPAKPMDRQIFHILSYGQKRPKEVRGYLLESRFDADDLGDRMPDLPKEYPWATKEKEGGRAYYYRTDIGRQPSIRKQPADYSDIEKLLLDLEIKLGVRSKRDLETYSDNTSSMPELLNQLLEYANRYGQILTTDEHLERFFNCLDTIIEQITRAYSTELPPPNYPAMDHALLLTVVAVQHESWKEGQAHEDFAKEVFPRVDDLVDLLDIVPPEVGSKIIRVLALVDIKSARTGFEKILQSGEYSEALLVTLAEPCYVHTGDMDDLAEKLNLLKLKANDETTRKTVESLLNALRTQFQM